jgi:HEAT repeat protein
MDIFARLFRRTPGKPPAQAAAVKGRLARHSNKVAKFDKLPYDEQQTKAKALAKQKDFDVLIAWVCQVPNSGLSGSVPAGILRDCDDELVRSTLIELLGDPSPEIRTRVAGAIGKSGGDTVEALCRNLKASPWSKDEIYEVTHALGRIGSPAAVEPLTQVRNRFSQTQYVAEALVRCGDKSGFDSLYRGLRDESRQSELSNNCACALERLDKDGLRDDRLLDEMRKVRGYIDREYVDPHTGEAAGRILVRHGAPPVRCRFCQRDTDNPGFHRCEH